MKYNNYNKLLDIIYFIIYTFIKPIFKAIERVYNILYICILLVYLVL